jgi:hypothetical protein
MNMNLERLQECRKWYDTLLNDRYIAPVPPPYVSLTEHCIRYCVGSITPPTHEFDSSDFALWLATQNRLRHELLVFGSRLDEHVKIQLAAAAEHRCESWSRLSPQHPQTIDTDIFWIIRPGVVDEVKHIIEATACSYKQQWFIVN